MCDEHYEKIKVIGNGAFGRCFLCKKSDNSFVVLKKISYNEKALEEAKILSDLQHYNVVSLIATYRSINSIYIVLEYLAGGNLDQFIKKYSQTGINDCIILDYLYQICDALSYIHSKRIVHRDVKPVNCLLNDDYSIVKLADFGISVKLELNQMVKGKYGTSAYMSPEILDGREYDFKCDMWALGCILYELVERHRLFEGSTEMAVQYKICKGKFILNIKSKYFSLLRLLLTNSTINRPTSKDFLLIIKEFSNELLK